MGKNKVLLGLVFSQINPKNKVTEQFSVGNKRSTFH